MADLWKYAVGSCIGALVTGGLVIVALPDPKVAVSEPAVTAEPHKLHAAPAKPPVARPVRAEKVQIEARVFEEEQDDPSPSAADRAAADHAEHLQLLAKHVLPRGQAHAARDESLPAAKREEAQRLVERMDAFDRRLLREHESPERAEALLEVLTESLSATLRNTYVQEGDCSETLCRFALIHEDDAAALQFHPHVLDGVDDAKIDVILDRGRDGELRHWLYFDSQ